MTPRVPLTPPTPREQQVLMLLLDGLSNKAIADRLTIAPHTVKFHVERLMTKLDAMNRTQVVVAALRQGWLTL